MLPITGYNPVNRLTPLFEPFVDEPPAVWEDEQNVYVEADAPGVAEGDVDITFNRGELVIRGERKCLTPEGAFDPRAYGRFERRVAVPIAVEASRAEARLAGGVLSVTLPRSEAARPRRIAVKAQ